MNHATISSSTLLRHGRCTIELVEEKRHPRRPWAWTVRWTDEEGIAGDASTLEEAVDLAVAAAERVAEIDSNLPRKKALVLT